MEWRAGTERGHCPDCDREVALVVRGVRRAPPPAPPAEGLPEGAPEEVPTFPPAPPTPGWLALERVAPPEEPPAPPPVDEGPFRTAGRALVTRRRQGPVEIAARMSTGHKLGYAIALAATAVAPALLITPIAAMACTPVLFLLGAQALRRRRLRLAITETELIYQVGVRRRAVPRAGITHLYAVGSTFTRSDKFPPRELRCAIVVVVDGRSVRVGEVASRAEANTIVELLAAELRIPTWVPSDCT